MRLNPRNRLLLALSVILFVTFTGASLLNYLMTRDSVRAEIIRKDLPLTMDNIYSELTAELMRPLLISSSMASDAFLVSWAKNGEKDMTEIIRYLAQLKDNYGFFTTFFVSTESSIYYRYNGVNKRVSQDNGHDVWFYDFLASGKEYMFDVDSDEAASNILTIFINYRVFDAEGKVLGVVGVGVKVDRVAGLVANYGLKYGRTVYLTDGQGVVQVHPETKMIEHLNIKNMEGIKQFAVEILGKNSDVHNFSFDRGDRHILLTVRYIKNLDWYLYVEQDETTDLTNARTNFLRTVVIGFVSSCGIIILTLMTINRYQAKLEAFAVSDVLTGALNRRGLEIEFTKIIAVHARSRQPFSLILLDLDGFKLVNDLKGHLAGDTLLKRVVELITQVLRPMDILARWGGDEFVVLAGSTAVEVVVVAERIREIIHSAELGGPGSLADNSRNTLSVSCGVTVYKQGDSFDDMLLRADQALYACKAKGGNCVESVLAEE